MSVMIGRTNNPIGNCRFGLWEEKNSAMRLRIFLIKWKITPHSFEVNRHYKGVSKGFSLKREILFATK